MHRNIMLISGSTNYIISSNGFRITVLDKGKQKVKDANLRLKGIIPNQQWLRVQTSKVQEN